MKFGQKELDVSILMMRTFVTAAAVLIMPNPTQTNQVASTSLAPVVWTSKNPIFKSSKNDHVIEVKLFDDIDFVCPYFDPMDDDFESHEYLTIYMVTRAEYDDCRVHPQGSAQPILNCTNPHQRKRFTILFEPFQSIPNAHEYQAGESYHYITTSTLKPDGLDSLHQGACYERNMKLTIRVCCSNSETKETASQLNSIAKLNHSVFTLKSTTKRKSDVTLGPRHKGQGQKSTAESRSRTTAPMRPTAVSREFQTYNDRRQQLKAVIARPQSNLQTQHSESNSSDRPIPVGGGERGRSEHERRLPFSSAQIRTSSVILSLVLTTCLIPNLMTSLMMP